jgi:hypothetical protein
MKHWVCCLLLIAGIGGAASVRADDHPTLKPATSKQFAVGQVWRYKTRPVDEGSRVIIGKIEQAPELGTIVHVKLTGLSLKAPNGMTASVVSHLPVSEAKVSASVTELTKEVGDLEGFSDGYAQWAAAFHDGRAGVYTLTLSEIVELTQKMINGEAGDTAPPPPPE